MSSLAFAGAGWIAAVHGLAARALGLPVTHVASRDPRRAAERAIEMGAVACRYEDLPAGADVVVVCTPPFRHAHDTLHALERGANVVVEKPLCTTLQEADRLVAATSGPGPRLGYAENLAYAPIVVELARRAGALGPLRHVEARCIQSRPTWGDFLTSEWGGGALFDLGVHPIAVVLLIAGHDDAVTAVTARLEGADDHPTDEYAEVTLRFESGLVATVVSSWRGGAVPHWSAQAASDTGVVQAELLPTPELAVNGEPVPLATPTASIPQLEQYGYLAQLRAFTDDFAAGRTPFMDVAFGRTVLDLVCAAYASAGRDGAEESIPFTGPRDRTPLQLWRG